MSNIHLLVLSSDGSLRMYDVSKNAQKPERIFYFGKIPNVSHSHTGTVKKKKSRIFTPILEEFEAVSFCFGDVDDLAWGGFTVYGLMRNGDIYCISPVIPKRL